MDFEETIKKLYKLFETEKAKGVDVQERLKTQYGESVIDLFTANLSEVYTNLQSNLRKNEAAETTKEELMRKTCKANEEIICDYISKIINYDDKEFKQAAKNLSKVLDSRFYTSDKLKLVSDAICRAFDETDSDLSSKYADAFSNRQIARIVVAYEGKEIPALVSIIANSVKDDRDNFTCSEDYDNLATNVIGMLFHAGHSTFLNQEVYNSLGTGRPYEGTMKRNIHDHFF